MIWAGRVNAISGLVAFVGLIFMGLTFLFDKNGPGIGDIFLYIALALVFGAVAIRVGFGLADMFFRAFLGKPLVYKERVDFENGKQAQVSE